MARGGPADAHDAGRGPVRWLGEGQLMLMMLAVVLREGQLMLMMLAVVL